MKLKALTIGLAMSFPLLASAQGTSVTLYGNIDTAIEYVNNIATYNELGERTGKKSSTHFTNLTQSWPSYWGLRGEEKLSDGLSAVFALESGFNAGTGQSGQGGRLFGRQAWVGLKGDWGQFAMGRQYNMLFWGLMNADIMGPNAYGLGTLDSYIPNARMDNAVTYRGSFDGFKVGAAYSFGRDNATTGGPAATNCGTDYTSNSTCTAYSFMLGYDAPDWGVAAAYDVIKGGYNVGGIGTTWGGLYNDSQKDRRIMANAYVKFDDLKVSLIYINRKNDGYFNTLGYSVPLTNAEKALGNRTDLWSLGAAYNVSPAVTIDGSVNYLKYKNADESSRAWYYVARAKYAFSKRTSTYISAAYMNNKGLSGFSAAGGTAGDLSPGVGRNQTAVMAGLRHSF